MALTQRASGSETGAPVAPITPRRWLSKNVFCTIPVVTCTTYYSDIIGNPRGPYKEVVNFSEYMKTLSNVRLLRDESEEKRIRMTLEKIHESLSK